MCPCCFSVPKDLWLRYETVCIPSEFICRSQTHDNMAFYEEVQRALRVMSSWMTLTRERQESQPFTFPPLSFLFSSVYHGMMQSKEEAERCPWPGIRSARTLPDLGLLKRHQKISSCCLHHPVYVTLWPEWTKTHRKNYHGIRKETACEETGPHALCKIKLSSLYYDLINAVAGCCKFLSVHFLVVLELNCLYSGQ